MEPRTLTEIILRSFERFRRQDHFGFKQDGRWRTLTSLEVLERARTLAGALAEAGIGHGDRVAIVSPTRWEWVLTDYACHFVRAVVVPIYPTLTAAQMEYILRHSGARMAFVAGGEPRARLASARANLPGLERVVCFDPDAEGTGVASFTSLLASTATFRPYGPFPDDLASIIYTSGTTGDPKGVLLTHENIASNVVACTAACPFSPSDRHLSFLPLSHVFERMVHYYMVWNGVSEFFAEDFGRLKENLLEVQPTVLTSVPRVFEKVLEGLQHEARPGTGLRGRVVRAAIDAAREWCRAREAGPELRSLGLGLGLRHFLAERLVYRRLRASLGGRLRVVVTGGAATPAAVTEFFNGAGIVLLPGYGLTEASPVVAFNTTRHFQLGTVGRPVQGVEVRIAEDGEILVRGPNVMQGYYKNDEATRASLTPDGWLRTGDIGELDGRGFLRITDRKKDLLVTAGGKKIAPQPLEQELCEDPLIAQAVMVGDTRPYLTALIVPRFSALEAWARARGLPTHDRAQLLARPEVQALFRERVDAVSARHARFESIKRFRLLEHELSEAGGELTPTLKVKRRVVVEKYRDAIESLYA